MFEIRHLSPQEYRQHTRKSSIIIMLVFAVLGMGLSSLAVHMFGEPGGSNFRWNLLGVLIAAVGTILLVRLVFWTQPWMSWAVYGWQLKRSLMRVTNNMHHVEAAVAVEDPSAMKLLRFYHLGLTEMHKLDDNTSALSELYGEREAHLRRLQELGISGDQFYLDPAWLAVVKQFSAKR